MFPILFPSIEMRYTRIEWALWSLNWPKRGYQDEGVWEVEVLYPEVPMMGHAISKISLENFREFLSHG